MFHPSRTADTTPRMRGLRRNDSFLAAVVRYNPAYAGTTGNALRNYALLPIQPRVCGDYLPLQHTSDIVKDTTPRMRGLRLYSCRADTVLRYNPAYAGTTEGFFSLSHGLPIQPRVCGDYARVSRYNLGKNDTTPRMRGLQPRISIARGRGRYNPAYAGTTSSNACRPSMSSIQPRVCGDYLRKCTYQRLG